MRMNPVRGSIKAKNQTATQLWLATMRLAPRWSREQASTILCICCVSKKERMENTENMNKFTLLQIYTSRLTSVSLNINIKNNG